MDFELATSILAKHKSVNGAVRELRTTRHTLQKAFKRAGYGSPSKWLSRPTTGRLISSSPIIRKPINPPPVSNSPLMAFRKRIQYNNKAKRYIVLSDIHVPYHDPNCIDAICQFMRDLPPDGLVLNGDVLDLEEVSTHSAGSVSQLEGKRLAHTFKEGNKLLDKLDKAAGPQCVEKHFIEGNHESRWPRWIARGDNSVFADDQTTSIPGRLNLEARGYEWHGNYPEGHVELGHLMVLHGRWTGKHPAAQHLEKYGHSCLIGHVHTPAVTYRSGWRKQQAGFSTGHLALEDSEVVKYAPKPNNWSQGFAMVYVAPDKTFQVTLLNFYDGVFYYGNKQYGAKK